MTSAAEPHGEHSFLEVRGLSKSFGQNRVLEGIDLELVRGQTLALLGPSGSGKTTLLRILAGFETADEGSVQIEGRSIEHLPAQRRGFGMVFQSYALFPHLSVADNIAFGLQAQKTAPALITERVEAMLELVDLVGFGARRIDEISGGQQQRVALARALAPEPKLLMLDEPLSNLDPDLRDRTRRALRETLEAVGITTVLVTHEQEEAFELGDQVALLHSGVLQQVATPRELYREPATGFVARFVGRSNILEVEALRAPLTVLLRVGGGTLECQARTPQPVMEDSALEAALRPEAWQLLGEEEAPASSPAVVWGTVASVLFLGSSSLLRVALEGSEETLEVEHTGRDLKVGARVGVRLRSDAVASVFPRRMGKVTPS